MKGNSLTNSPGHSFSHWLQHNSLENQLIATSSLFFGRFPLMGYGIHYGLCMCKILMHLNDIFVFMSEKRCLPTEICSQKCNIFQRGNPRLMEKSNLISVNTKFARQHFQAEARQVKSQMWLTWSLVPPHCCWVVAQRTQTSLRCFHILTVWSVKAMNVLNFLWFQIT